MQVVMTWLPGNSGCVVIFRLKGATVMCLGEGMSLLLLIWLNGANFYTHAPPSSLQPHFLAVLSLRDFGKFFDQLHQSLLLLQLSRTNCKHAPELLNERCTNTVPPFLEAAALFSHVLSACTETGLGGKCRSSYKPTSKIPPPVQIQLTSLS